MCTGIFKAQQYKYTPTLFFGAIYSPDIFLSFLLPRQITDATLIQLSIYCPRLQVLVSVWLQRFCFLFFDNVQPSNPALGPALTPSSLRVPAESIALWADHRRRHQTPGQRALCSRPSGGDRVGQLPPDHRRLAGAPEELPQSGPHRALRLPADHSGWDQETKGEFRPRVNHIHKRLKNTFFFFFLIWQVSFWQKKYSCHIWKFLSKRIPD